MINDRKKRQQNDNSGQNDTGQDQPSGSKGGMSGGLDQTDTGTSDETVETGDFEESGNKGGRSSGFNTGINKADRDENSL